MPTAAHWPHALHTSHPNPKTPTSHTTAHGTATEPCHPPHLPPQRYGWGDLETEGAHTQQVVRCSSKRGGLQANQGRQELHRHAPSKAVLSVSPCPGQTIATTQTTNNTARLPPLPLHRFPQVFEVPAAPLPCIAARKCVSCQLLQEVWAPVTAPRPLTHIFNWGCPSAAPQPWYTTHAVHAVLTQPPRPSLGGPHSHTNQEQRSAPGFLLLCWCCTCLNACSAKGD